MRLSIDPGKTCGIAWRNDAGELRGVQWPGESIAAILDGMESAYGLTEIVIENFRSRPGPAVNLSAPEVIGRVYAWADGRGVAVVRQDASPVKVRVTSDRLRAAGGWKRGEEHARDALRHLIYREEKLGLIDLAEGE
jgi:hypothetical protein